MQLSEIYRPGSRLGHYLTPKITRVMKLTAILLFCAGLFANANGHSQTITLDLKNSSLQKVFSEVVRQTGTSMVYNEALFNEAPPITIKVKNATVPEVLNKCLQGLPYTFNIKDNTIVIKANSLHIIAQNDIQDIRISGVITDDRGTPLQGASILLKGTNNGTSTDNEGRYVLNVPALKGVLIFSFTGFQSKEITIAANTVINVSLLPENKTLNDVIVTGYTRQSKHEVTGAASTLSADVIAQTPVTDITTALQGRIAGVNVDDQGGPGNAGVIRIRGVGSLGNNDPLYVIDGVQVRVGGATGSQNIASLLNPNDIESLTILKDPSLTALYGSEGSNGVIVITTKSGKKGEPRLEYSAYVGEQVPFKFPSMVTPQQQADALYQSYKNSAQAFPYTSFYGSGTSPVLPDFIIESQTPNVGIGGTDPASNPSLYNFLSYRILKANKSGTDWWKTLFRPSLVQNHQLSISGGTDKSNFAISFGYLDDQGTLLNSYFKRLSLRVNTDFKVKPWLRVGESAEFSYSTNNTISTSNLDNNQGNFNNEITNLYALSPLLPTHDIAGNIAGTGGASSILGGSNPLISRTNSSNSKNHTQSVVGSAYIEFEPIKNLTFQSKIGVQFVPNQYHSFNDSFPQEPIPSHTTYYYDGNSTYTDWRWLNKIAYSFSINNIHKISAFAAYESRELQSRYSNIVMTNLISNQPNFQYTSDGVLNPNFPPSGLGSVQTSTSEFGNITYSLMDKYLFSGTIRNDASSIFGINHQHGTFPAASAGWRVSQEKFMKNINWIDDLKLRGSWGKSGNDAIPPGKQFGLIRANDPIYGGYDLAGTNISQILGAYSSQIGNPDIHWETNETTNLGFDAAFLNNRLTASFNWFNRKTKDLLYAPPYTGTAGAAAAPYKNIMSFTNKGIELELGFKSAHKNNNAFQFDMNFNISSYKSNVDFIDGDSATFIDLATFAPTHYNLTRSMVGHPVSSFYGYVFNGIYQDTTDVRNSPAQPGISGASGVGHFKFRDLSGPNGKPDGKIGPEDQTFLGNPNPKFSFGYNLNLYYKNFDLGLFVQGVYGNKIFNYFRSFSMWPGMFGSGSLDTWTPTHTDAKLPIYTQDGINNNNDNVPSSFFVEDGSYLRLKTVQLGYTFPANRSFKHLRIYVQAYNLATITNYSGQDPEVNNGNPGTLGIDFGTQYPNSRKILFGLNLGL